MIRLRSRKGVSGAISAMFVIAIFFIILVSLFVYTGLLNSYNQTVTDRNRMDWERDSESIFFIAAEVKSGVLNLNFSNDGGVTLHLVQVWLSQFPNSSYSESKNQSQYWTSRYVSSGQTVNNFGSTTDFKRVNIGSIGAPIPLSGLSEEHCKIKLVTERGNVFECQIPWPPENPSGGGSSGGYVLQIDNDEDNFEFASGMMDYYDDGYVAIAKVKTLYRVLIVNTSPNDIVLMENSTMNQMEGAVGQVTLWYIVSPSNDVTTAGYIEGRSANPYVDLSLTILAGEQGYIYFGATTLGGSVWQQNPNQDCLISFVLWFHFVGDPEDRCVPTPVIYQVLRE